MYCIGIEESPKRVYLLMVEAKSKSAEPLKVLRLVLDQNTVSIVSPFYKHYLMYSLMEDDLDGPSYRLEQWIKSEFRIKKKDSETTFATAIRDIVRNSFFPLLQKTSVVKEWQTNLFCWDSFHRGLGTRYHQDFSLKQWTSENVLGRVDYWKAFREDFKHLLDPVIKSLEINKNTVVENDRQHLFLLLDQWKTQPHITGYLRHRLLEMSFVQELFQRGLARVRPLCTLNYREIHDLFELHKWLDSFGENGTLENYKPKYQNQEHLVLKVLKDSLLEVLKHYLLHRISLDDFDRKEIRRLVVENFIVPVIKKSLEQNALFSKSTLLPITRKSLLYYYKRIFSIHSIKEEVSISEDSQEEEGDMEIIQTEEYRGDILDFDSSHSGEFLSYCIDGLKGMNDERWLQSEKKNTLFILKVKEEINKVEEHVKELWCEKMNPSEYRIYGSDFQTNEWQESFMNMDDIDRALYQIRFSLIVFTLKELKEGRDLFVVKEMLRENIFQISLVRSNKSLWTKNHLSLFIKGLDGDISTKDLDQRLYTTQSLCMNTGKCKPLLVILDSHLFPLKEVHTLLRFIERRKLLIKRVVFLGSLDILPLDSDGHGFIDLIQWKEAYFIKHRIFQFTSLRKETLDLVHDMKESGKIQYIQLNQLEKHFLDSSTVLIKMIGGEENIKEFLGPHQIKLVELKELIEQQEGPFMIRKSLLEKLSRNEVNNLILYTEPFVLIVLLDTDLSKKWSLKEENYPNLRYTLPFI